jgi:hypothetical protein
MPRSEDLSKIWASVCEPRRQSLPFWDSCKSVYQERLIYLPLTTASAPNFVSKPSTSFKEEAILGREKVSNCLYKVVQS